MSKIADDSVARSPFSFRDGVVLAAFVGGCVGLGGLGSLLTNEGLAEWYPTLTRPPLTPPNWIFGPVWTTLYAMMGVAAWLVWRRRGEIGSRAAFAWFGVQLALNTLWSALFFTLRSPALALVDILLLWCAIGMTTRAFSWHSIWAGRLLWPYWAWVSFATYLNVGYWRLNR